MSDGVYDRLAAPFAQTFGDTRGGVTFRYVTGEQVATRLNEVLGPGGWSFKVLHQELHVEADEWWLLGQLSVQFDPGVWVTREQYGSQKVRRSRATGAPLDLGNDLKGAATDAFKKTATLIGVGLYLSHKEGQAAQPKRQSAPSRPAVTDGPVVGGGNSIPPEHREQYRKMTPSAGPLPDIFCVECGQLVEPVAKKDGGMMTASEITDLSQKTFERLLCGNCFKIAVAAKNAVSGAPRAR